MKRLKSLDILRGFDLLLLVYLGGIIKQFARATGWEWLKPVTHQLRHMDWIGYSVWDHIMPLFMFMAGVSIPFAFAKYREENRSKGKIYGRIARRVVLLWIFGMISQGNLLSLKPADFAYFSNTLQSIAVGYLVSAIMFLNTKPRTQIISAAALLVVYWAGMMFIKVDGCGGGDLTPDHNFAIWLDQKILGKHDDGTSYTWIWSSLNFIVTVMTGMFAGEVMKSDKHKEEHRAYFMMVLGVILIIAGKLWGLQMPIIKHLWTSSMTLFSSGISFILMGVFYYCIDCRGWSKGFEWLKYYGMNSIFVYMIGRFVKFNHISESVLWGFGNYLPDEWYKLLISIGGCVLLTLVLKHMYKDKIFLRL